MDNDFNSERCSLCAVLRTIPSYLIPLISVLIWTIFPMSCNSFFSRYSTTFILPFLTPCNHLYNNTQVSHIVQALLSYIILLDFLIAQLYDSLFPTNTQILPHISYILYRLCSLSSGNLCSDYNYHMYNMKF